MLKAPYDLIFIDADKVNNPRYLEWAIQLSREGTVIVGDNVVRGGGVIDSDSNDPNVQGLREFIQMISEDERLEATAIQTVGEKGWDGFIMAIVKAI
jgi:predicted O-methyltransferase YrrM